MSALKFGGGVSWCTSSCSADSYPFWQIPNSKNSFEEAKQSPIEMHSLLVSAVPTMCLFKRLLSLFHFWQIRNKIHAGYAVKYPNTA